MSQRSTSSKYGLGYEGASTSSTKPIPIVKSSNMQTSSLDVPLVESKASKISTKGKTSHNHHNEPKKLEKSKLKAKNISKPKVSSNVPKPKGHSKEPKTKIISKSKAYSHGSFRGKPKVHNNKFAKSQCFYCMHHGHINIHCHIRKVQLKLIPMDQLKTNPQGPKYLWVPKSLFNTLS